MTETTVAANQSIMSLIFNASPVVQVAFLILVIFSVISWAIIFLKFKQFGQVDRSSKSFWHDFHNSKSLEDIFARRKPGEGPLFRLFYVGFSGLVGANKQRNPRDYERVVRDINRAEREELGKLENQLPFLATTASTAPFVGLFGTVIGILVAMWKIGTTGNTSLAVVAPAIAEALIATALGLAVAIPAYVFYNFFIRKTQKASQDFDFFTDDLEYRLKREYGVQAS